MPMLSYSAFVNIFAGMSAGISTGIAVDYFSFTRARKEPQQQTVDWRAKLESYSKPVEQIYCW